MPVKVSFEPIGPSLALMIKNTLGPEAQAKAFKDFAIKEIAKADRQNMTALGRVPEKVIYVDGKMTTNLNDVQVPGVVLVEYEIVTDVVEQMLIYLRRNAPVLSGRFRESIWIYADGVRVRDPAQTINAQEVIIVPTTAYARKIERGQGKAPGKLFENAAKYAQKKFRGGGASIRFSFADIAGGNTHLEAWARKRKGRNRQQKVVDRRNPALIIRFK